MAEKTVYIIDLNDRVTGKLKGVQAQASKTDKSVLGLGNAFTMTGFAAGAGISALAGIAKGIFDITAGAEMTKASFEVMLGSEKKALEMIGDIRKFAAATPFETTDLEQATNTLLGFGVEADKIMPTLKMLGDVSGGSADRFQRLSLVFAQTQSAGKLMGQDLLQYINAGFNPLKILSEQTGVKMNTLRAMMSDGMISAEMVSAAFEAATGEGGRYFGLLERQSTTLSGKLSTLVDNIKLMGLSIGESNIGVFHSILDGIAASLRNLEPFKDVFTQFGQSFGFMSQIFSSFGGESNLLIFFKYLATLIKTVLLPIEILGAKLMTIIDLIKSIPDMLGGDFSAIDRGIERITNPFKTYADIWTDDKKATGNNVAPNMISALSGGMFNQQGPQPFVFGANKKTDPFAELRKNAGLFGEDGKKAKTTKQTAGGISLTESKNGITHITFNIDKFQNNEFREGKNTAVPDDIQKFLDKMKTALSLAINDAQVAANVG